MDGHVFHNQESANESLWQAVIYGAIASLRTAPVRAAQGRCFRSFPAEPAQLFRT